MSLIREVLTVALEYCRAEARGFLDECKLDVQALACRLGKLCASMCVLSVAVTLLLGALGLMIAALVVGLTQYLGVTWSLMIGAGGAILGGLILLKISCWLGK